MMDYDESQHYLTEASKYDREWQGKPDTSWKDQTFLDPWSLEDLITFAPTLVVPPSELPAIERDIEQCMRKPLWKIEREADRFTQQHHRVRLQIIEAGYDNPAVVAKGKMVGRQMAHLENINEFMVEMARKREVSAPMGDMTRGNLPYQGRGGVVKAVAPDTAYLWQVEGTDIYKVGITTAHRGADRIEEVARGANVNAVVLELTQVRDARALEARLMTIGRPASAGTVNGHTEFRVFTTGEAEQTARLIRAAAT